MHMTKHLAITERTLEASMRLPVVAVVCLLHLVLLWLMCQAGVLSQATPEKPVRALTVQFIQEPKLSEVPSLDTLPGERSVAQGRTAIETKGLRAATHNAYRRTEKPDISPSLTARTVQPPTANSETREAVTDERLGESAKSALGDESSRGARPLVLDYQAPRTQSKTAAEMVREQLNPDPPRNLLAEGIRNAVVPKCAEGSDAGLFNLPLALLNNKCKW